MWDLVGWISGKLTFQVGFYLTFSVSFCKFRIKTLEIVIHFDGYANCINFFKKWYKTINFCLKIMIRGLYFRGGIFEKYWFEVGNCKRKNVGGPGWGGIIQNSRWDVATTFPHPPGGKAL